MKHIILLLKISMLGSLVFILTACGGGETGGAGDPDAPKPEFSTANYDIYLPPGVQTLALPSALDGIYIFDGNDGSGASQKPRSANLARSADIPETSERDVAGISMQFSPFNAETTASEMLTAIDNLINTSYSSNFSKRQVVSGELDAINAQLEISVSAQMKPTDLLNKIILLLSDEVTEEQLSPALDTELAFDRFTMNIGIVYFDSSDIMISITLVSSNLSSLYASVVSKITDTGNVLEKGTRLVSGSDSFTALASGGVADFLFVVDNSGSMSDEQTALSEAADAFIDAIEGSGLDYSIAVITTDSQALRGTGFTSDTEQFKIDVKPGTRGSGTESGIYYAELALSSTALGGSSNGSVTGAGYPREDASLSVIFLSDEPNSYRGSPNFDPLNNLFLDRSYGVFAIINEYSRISGEYDDLANATTAGFTADIDNTTLFPTIMGNIAQAAGGSASSFVLSRTPVSSTIEVTVDGLIATSSSIDGWTYSTSSNSIIFHGDAIPVEGANVVVSYFYGQTIISNAGSGVGDVSELQGTWASGCIQEDLTYSYISTFTFTGNAFVAVDTNYSDASCSVFSETETSTGTFTVGDAITTTLGRNAYKVDATVSEGNGVEATQQYDIYSIVNGKLYFGMQEGISTESNRPMELDLSQFWSKI